MATKYTAFGSKLQIADSPDSPSTWTDVPSISGLGVPLGVVETTEVTTHDSPGRYREYIQTMRDGGELTFDVILDWTNAVHQQLIEATGALGYERFKVLAPDATELAEFNAFVSLDGTSGLPVDGAVTASCTLRTTGAIVLPFLS